MATGQLEPSQEDVKDVLTTADDPETEVERMRTISRFLDNSIRIPKTDKRFGVDALSGLVPGIGDLIAAGFSVYILYRAYLLGLPYATLGRMLVNVTIDTIVGVLPVVGDVFDFVWKSNERNVDLVERRTASLDGTKRDKWIGVAFVSAPLLAIAVIVFTIASVAL